MPHGVTPAPTLMTMDELCALLRVSRSTVERAIRSDPAFPQPRRLAQGRLVRFLVTEVRAYLTALQCVEYADHGFDPNAAEEE